MTKYHPVFTLQDQRNHKAILWRNIRRADRECEEHSQMLRKVYAPILNLRLPRILKPKTKP